MNAVASLKGYDLGSRVVSYDESDAILYALCVGARPDQLPLVYERDLHVLPTFGLGLGLWAVEEKETGALLGRIGCFYPEGFPRFEVGYTLVRHAWGKGYASEGAAAALDYARTVLKRAGVTSVIKDGNLRSAAVAKRLGAVHVDTVPFYNATAWIYQYPDTA